MFRAGGKCLDGCRSAAHLTRTSPATRPVLPPLRTVHLSARETPARSRLPRFASLLLAALGLSGPAAAQTVRAVEVVTDNDVYAFWTPTSERADAEYTHGMWVAVEVDAAPGWRRLVGGRAPCRAGAAPPAGGCVSTRFELGQKLFTPRVDDDVPVPGQRPYAGWLFVRATAQVAEARRRREAGVEVGVTGEPSLGRVVHAGFHRAAGFWEPRGWRNQVDFEPGVVLHVDERRMVADGWVGGVRVAELVPEWGVALGNVLTGARAGARARLGWRVPHPWNAEPGSGGASVYLLAAGRGEWVGHSLFLDGNTFGDHGVRVARRPWVGQYEVGGGVRVRGLTAELTATRRGREYETQPGPHSFASITLRWERGARR